MRLLSLQNRRSCLPSHNRRRHQNLPFSPLQTTHQRFLPAVRTSNSRDEINRLIEIVNSRAVDVPKVDQESKDLILSAGGAKGPIVAQNPRRPTEEKLDALNKAVQDLTTPLPRPSLQDKTGSSPIEIAKTYMASQTPEVNLCSKCIISKDERPNILSDDFTPEPFVPSPSPKPSTCWPSSMVQDHRGYPTPISQRGRLWLHNISRTPYSRSIYFKSKSMMVDAGDEGNGFPNGSFSPLKHSQTPVYGQFKLRSNVVDDGQGSVGPNTRALQNLHPEDLFILIHH